MKKIFLCTKTIILVCVIVLIFSMGFAKVDGNSMQPTLKDNDIILYYKSKKNIKRFDIIIFKRNNNLFIKRVIGLPGDSIKYIDNTLYVNDNPTEEDFQKSITNDFNISDITSSDVIPNNKLFVLGDNRLFSTDGRSFGFIDINDVNGIMIIKI